MISAPVTLICASFYVGSPKGSPFFFYGEDFLGFFLEPFPGVITPAALAIVTLAIVIIIGAVTAIIIGGTFTKVKVFPFGETFQKVSLSTSL